MNHQNTDFNFTEGFADKLVISLGRLQAMMDVILKIDITSLEREEAHFYLSMMSELITNSATFGDEALRYIDFVSC